MIACFFGFIDFRDRWRDDHIRANKTRITSMLEAEVFSIPNEAREQIHERHPPAFTGAAVAITGTVAA